MHGLEVDRSLRRAAARRRRVSRGARAAEARRRVSALHAGAARDRLSALPGADAVDAGRAVHARPERSESGDGLRRSRAAAAMQGQLAGDDVTACEFRTAHDVTLWPIEIVSASYFSFAPDLPLNTLPVAQRIKGGLRIRLRTTAGLKFAQTSARPAVLLSRRPRRRREQAVRAVPGDGSRRAGGAVERRVAWHEFLPAGVNSAGRLRRRRSAACRSRCGRFRATGCCRSTSRFRSASGSSS